METKKKPLAYYSEYNEDVANQPCWTENPNHGRKDDSIHHAEGLISKLSIPWFVQKFNRGVTTGCNILLQKDEWNKFIVHEPPVVKAVKE